ncbi:MAG: bifunctional folylpolyglutamate synthase/dihydrofolate synthase [Acidimicrobiia bacterium]|nr:bifunctional folylpolyglutamate synthase/dihydrofolate synthase [Acidimicrobiia bacterium]
MHVRDWLFSLEVVGIKLGLSQIRRLLEALDHPEQAYPSITIAGTNGKGSVTAMVERGLRASGRRTGRYTSPHLINIEERIAINGVAIAPEVFDRLVLEVRTAAAALDAPPSFFEATTALALLAFRDAGVDIAVLEVGLGGRLDATNAVDASLVAITAIDLDHQEHLGHTLTAIAAEKAGVIKAGATVVVAPNPADVEAVIHAHARAHEATVVAALHGVSWNAVIGARGSRLTLTTPTRAYGECLLRLSGRHQITNAVVAVRTLEAVPDVPAAAVTTALADVEWPARLEWLQTGTTDVLLDGAHNPAGAGALSAFLAEMVGHPVPMVLGVMGDKAVEDIVAALAPAASHIVTTAAPSPRALSPDALAATCLRVAPDVPIAVDPDAARALATAAAHGAPVVVAGSLYLAGHVRQALTRRA